MPTLYYIATGDITVDGRSNAPENALNSGGAAAGLDNTTLTIAADATLQTVEINDSANTTFDDDVDAQQTLADPAAFGFAPDASVGVDSEWTLILSDGQGMFTAYGVAVGPSENIIGLVFLGDLPPKGVTLSVIETLEGAGDRGQPAVEYDALAQAICYTPGTLIKTPQGLRAVETLQPGDQIVTRDHGAQTLRWFGRSTLSAGQLRASPHLTPVLIKKDALGPGLPARDMHVSPNHRFLISGWRAEMLFGTSEVLVRAQAMRNDTNILAATATRSVDYIHLMFDRHEVITADGLPSESFQPADGVTDGLDAQVRNELLTLFPELRTGDLGDLARPVRATLDDMAAQTLLMR